MVGSEGCDISSWDVSSYKAAATTSLHPELEAYVQFVAMQSSPLVQYSIKSLLKVKVSNSLSTSEVVQLAMPLSSSHGSISKPLDETLETTNELSKGPLAMFMRFKEHFIRQQNFFP